jgi:hypothetical protein
MKITFEIETTEDAQRAQKALSAYIGNDTETVAEEPKKEVAKKTTTPRKSTKKKVEETPEEELEEVAGVDLKTLTGIAKDAVAKTDRAIVKDVIGEYGEKLSAVDEADYDALAAKLKAL